MSVQPNPIQLLMELRTKARATLLISEDLDELMKLSDRVGVMFGGRSSQFSDRGS